MIMGIIWTHLDQFGILQVLQRFSTPQIRNWPGTIFCRFLQQTSSSRLTGWMASPNESLNLRKYIFLRSELHINETAPSKKTWPHCVECCHFRLLEWAHGLATFFPSFFARKDSYTKCKKIATRILLSQFVFAFCILISSRLPQWVEIFTEGALFFRLWPEELRSIFFLCSILQKSNKNESQKFTD